MQNITKFTSTIDELSARDRGLLFIGAPVTKQYNLVPANGQWCLAAGKVTVGLASHWPCVTDISGSPPTGWRPWRGRWAPAYALLVEYGELYLYLYVAWVCICARWLEQCTVGPGVISGFSHCPVAFTVAHPEWGLHTHCRPLWP